MRGLLRVSEPLAVKPSVGEFCIKFAAPCVRMRPIFSIGRFMQPKDSVTARIATYLSAMIIVVALMSTLSLLTIMSNRSDAESINLSGSLRMQSYRLLNDMESAPDRVLAQLAQYQQTLNSSSLLSVQNQFCAPDELKSSYQRITARWQIMAQFAMQRDIAAYQRELDAYVNDLDIFVLELQRFAELKWIIAASVLGLSMLWVIAIALFVLWYMQREVVKPLQLMTKASMQVQLRQFHHVALDTQKPNELGILANAFTQMSTDLGKWSQSLEAAVNEKTQELRRTNRSLSTLYQSSQLLTSTKMSDETLRQVLQYVRESEHLRYLELEIFGAEHWDIVLGERSLALPSEQEELILENEKLALFSWQIGERAADPRMMKNLAQMLARALYFHQTQRQQEQLLLMEERAIIARELHDSLAQVLSFLQIQLTLLKHHLKKDDERAKAASLTVIKDFEQALSDGYVQLRELLATFRLTVQEANLQVALEQVINGLRNQTTLKMSVNCSLPSQCLKPPQMIHLLQIVREAVLNAIKHSGGSCIEVLAHINADGEYEILVQDDGIGIDSLDEPDGHYGLTIMHERARQLAAQLTIEPREISGTRVIITLPPTLF